MSESAAPFDSILLVSFGGPEGPDDVMPFLENVLRGKNVPQERMMEVAEHYKHFGGKSPINEQNRALIDSLRSQLDQDGIDLPIYWGNRNWHPLLPDTLREMRDAGKQRAIAFFTSMFSCYSGCRQYRENIEVAQAEVGEGVPQVEKLRMGFNHPLFIESQATLTREAIDQLELDTPERMVLFTAHSIPMTMADHSRYVEQLRACAALVADSAGVDRWELVFQSRSGPPHQPWLEPDICERIQELATDGMQAVVVVPIGFISDHMEVLFDLDTEAKELCEELSIAFARAKTVGTHAAFVSMIVDLIRERVEQRSERPALGSYGPSHDVCPKDCCLYPRPQRPART